MKTDPVTLLWHILRSDETAARPVTFLFRWPTATWDSATGSQEVLAELYRQHGTPVEARITDNQAGPPQYRCNLCGGLVQFDGTPPAKETRPCPSLPSEVAASTC